MNDFDGIDGTLPIGARLLAAREARGLKLADVAAKTRVPIRHLQHIEAGDWQALPAVTYCIGFVRSYANAVGLDGTAMGAELRDQLGAGAAKKDGAPLYEPADPARVPPRALAIAAGLLALILVIGYLVWRTNAADEPDALELATAAPAVVAAAPAPAPRPGPQPAVPTAGPVAVTAIDAVWLRIYEAGGTKLFEGTMAPGQRFEIPPAAQVPQILTGRPDAIRVTVGETQIPPLGPAQRTIAGVSLAPQDLLARLGTPAPPANGASPPPAAIAPGPVAQ
ncbi:MAG TPA: RodZ domain-containing protein [Allosphingosinicella sp.]|jgi:transcriptional regulator with XRE-family HTH domain